MMTYRDRTRTTDLPKPMTPRPPAPHSQFARGAKVRKPLDQELTMIEASFVMCSVAHREGYSTEERFIEYMRHAWINYVATASSNCGEGEHG
jgi:hypothetical protein